MSNEVSQRVSPAEERMDLSLEAFCKFLKPGNYSRGKKVNWAAFTEIMYVRFINQERKLRLKDFSRPEYAPLDNFVRYYGRIELAENLAKQKNWYNPGLYLGNVRRISDLPKLPPQKRLNQP